MAGKSMRKAPERVAEFVVVACVGPLRGPAHLYQPTQPLGAELLCSGLRPFFRPDKHNGDDLPHGTALERDQLAEESLFLLLTGGLILIFGAGLGFLLFLFRRSSRLVLVAGGAWSGIRLGCVVYLGRRGQ